jgi:hypothetical protein
VRRRQRIVNTTPSLRTRTAERQQRWEAGIVDALRTNGRVQDMSDLDVRLIVAATMTALRVAVDAWLADRSDELTDVLDTVFANLRAGFR